MNTETDNIHIPDYDRIDAFLRGKMTETEEAAFMQELNDNPELKDQATAMAQLVKGIKEVGREQDRKVMNALLDTGETEVRTIAQQAIQEVWKAQFTEAPRNVYYSFGTPPKPPTPPKRTTRHTGRWLSIAASVAIVVCLGLGYNSYRKTTNLANEYANVFESSMIMRGTDTPTEVEQQLERLFDNVKTKTDLKATLHELSRCWEQSTMDTYNEYTDYSAEIGWNLAIGYLQHHDKKQAKAVLEQLVGVSEPGTAIFNHATTLLNKLN